MDSPVAVLIFFSKTTCGYCKIFKGLKPDGTIDQNSGWETLKRDPTLRNLPLGFKPYQFGPEVDPKTGKTVQRGVDEPYASRMQGVPHFELFAPHNLVDGIPMSLNGLKGWDATNSVPFIREWVLKTVKSDGFLKLLNGPSKKAPWQVRDEVHAPAPEPMRFMHAPPTAFGMGTQQIKPAPIPQEQVPTPVPPPKKGPQFLPVNYDE